MTDTNNHRIAVYDPFGEFLYAMGKDVNEGTGEDFCSKVEGCVAGIESDEDGGFAFPFGLAADGFDLYVTDIGNDRVVVSDVFTGFERTFGEGVDDGAEAFQVCTADCRAGAESTASGGIPNALGIAVDCEGAVFTSEQIEAGFARVQRFGEPATPLPPCSGGEEEGELSEGVDIGGLPVPPPPSFPFIGSAVPPPVPVASNRFVLRRLVKRRGNGSAIAFVRVFAPGRVILWGRGIRTVARGTRRPRVVRVPVKPKVRLRRYLRRRGKARVRINVAFRPFGGLPRAPRERPVVLRKRRR